MFLRMCVCAFAVTLYSSATAQIINGGFETPAYGNGGFSDGLPGWTRNGEAGHWNIFPGLNFFNAEAPQGTQILYCNAASISQQTSSTLNVGETVLSTMAGRRSDTFAASFDMELWAGGTAVSGFVNGGTLLASAKFNHLNVTPGSFTPLQITYNATANDASLGQFLSVRFVRTAGSQTNLDDVRLTAAVPEPATMAALALGLAATLRRRKSGR
jgi:hypothetical protein